MSGSLHKHNDDREADGASTINADELQLVRQPHISTPAHGLYAADQVMPDSQR